MTTFWMWRINWHNVEDPDEVSLSSHLFNTRDEAIVAWLPEANLAQYLEANGQI